jgi:hypothetical protein
VRSVALGHSVRHLTNIKCGLVTLRWLTHVIRGNLSFTAPTPPNLSTYYAAILIPTSLPGAVILDLKGFTLTSNGANVTASVGVGIGGVFVGPFVANAFPITVRNGSL